MRIYKTKIFRRFQRKEALTDADLAEAIARVERGLIDADLGRGLIKQRVARKGAGRSGGFRTVIAYRAGTRAVFLFGFAKSAQSNLAPNDERDLADYGRMLLDLGPKGIERLIDDDELTEVDEP